MNKEEAVEGIKRHAEAILNLAKAIGVDDYLSMAIVDGHVMIDNNPADRHTEDGVGVRLYYLDGEWEDLC